jgi:hypothetical protein
MRTTIALVSLGAATAFVQPTSFTRSVQVRAVDCRSAID